MFVGNSETREAGREDAQHSQGCLQAQQELVLIRFVPPTRRHVSKSGADASTQRIQFNKYRYRMLAGHIDMCLLGLTLGSC